MNELFSLARMARRLGVTQQWLRDQADAGEVPCLKAGKHYLFSLNPVQDALAGKAALRWTPKTGPVVKVESWDSAVVRKGEFDGEETEAAFGGV